MYPNVSLPPWRRPLLTIASVAVGLGLVTSCGGSAGPTSPRAGATPAATQAATSVGPVFSPGPPVQMSLPPYQPVIDPANFVTDVSNTYFPLTVGTTLVYDGMRDGTIPRHHEVTVTSETKDILGVTCVVVRDVVTTNSALVEKTTDWYAQDKDGNVWYFGEDTAEYENGQIISTAGTWMGGVDGALPGYIMKAQPKVDEGYRQEYRPGVAEDYATVRQLGTTTTTAAGNYQDVVVTEDIDLLDASKFDTKHYAPGVGLVATEGTAGGHTEVTGLTSILHAQ